MSKILKLNSYSQYDELGDRDYMVYEVKYDDGHKEYVSRDIFRNLKALEIIKETEVNVYMLTWYFKHSSYEQYVDDFERNRRDCDLPDLGNKLLIKEEYDLLKEELL